MSSILMTCRDKARLEKSYIPALRGGGWDGDLQIRIPGDGGLGLEGVGGMLLAGGGDIHPRRWDGEEALHLRSEPDEERDSLEIPLLLEAWRLGIPIFGICRGAQVLNVALGGSLFQDIPSQFHCPSDLHQHGSPDVPELWHSVHVAPASRLGSIVGLDAVEVNSRHHQAVARLAPELRAVAWHDGTQRDGQPLLEGVESADEAHWALGVQWHPENLVTLKGDGGEAARRLFRAFVEAVR